MKAEAAARRNRAARILEAAETRLLQRAWYTRAGAVLAKTADHFDGDATARLAKAVRAALEHPGRWT
jgi:hypothetical protein